MLASTVGLGILQLQALQRVDDNLRDRDIAIPLHVGGNRKPGRVLRAGLREHVFIRIDVVIPELALLEVRVGELPMLLRVVQPRLQPTRLLLLRDIEEEFQDDDVILGKRLLEAIDLLDPLLDDLPRDLAVNTRREYVLIVRPVEDLNHPARRDGGMHAPQKVMLALKRCRHLERGHVASLRIDAREDVADRTVLACRVHPPAAQSGEPSAG